ncbi:MAG: DNA replication/repair protein RecF [Clostridia bacterium]|nr:DNA replication/repair protein RecF [Clostridia bacterium]
MQVTRLTFEDYRNLETGQWEPYGGVNVIVGENAQGKTNLLEALWLFTGGKSFRGAKDSELVGFSAEQCRLTMDFIAAEREQQAEITVKARRSATLNGVSLSSASKLAGTFCGVVFSPAHLSLIKGGPQERRRLIDAAYCQLRPSYVSVLTEYARVLTQRNALCKAKTGGDAVEELLELWDRQLAQSGCRLIHARQRYIQKMAPVAREIYQGLSGGKESFDIRYVSTVEHTEEKTAAEIAAELFDFLQKHHREDLAAGFTTVGPHRDDMEVLIDNRSARSFGSQGQQRSAVLAIKIAEAVLLEEVTGERPIALLDDVMSELDTSRQEYILNHIRDWQVFITCCEPTPLMQLRGGKQFCMSNGKLSTIK